MHQIEAVIGRGTRLVPERLREIALKLIRVCKRLTGRVEKFYGRLRRNWALRIMVSVVGGKDTISNFLIQLRPYLDMLSLALHTITLYAALSLIVVQRIRSRY